MVLFPPFLIFWPKMREEIREFVSNCKVCQMSKALKPQNQGLLRGRRHTAAGQELCIDLVGPITGAKGHVRHGTPLHILVAIDPFTHMVWLEPLHNKSAAEVLNAFVDRILLEEGAPRVIRCDNGTEFKNSIFNDLASLMKTKLQYSPAYWPQSNQCERLNRFIGETLRAMTNTPNGRKQDWNQYLKYIEFAYRSAPIKGTSITPFVAARGRQPRLVIDNPMMSEELATPSSLDEHVKQVQALQALAASELEAAKDKVMAANADLQNLHRHDEEFEVGENVLFYNRLVGSEEEPSKLKLRTQLYVVRERAGDIYMLESLEFAGDRRRAHVGQLIRFRGDPRDPDEEAATTENVASRGAPGAAGREGESRSRANDPWSHVDEGRFIIVREKGAGPADLHCGEVLQKKEGNDEGGEAILVWYYVDRRAEDCDNFTKPLRERRLVPEWVEKKSGKVELRPSRATLAKGGHIRREEWLTRRDITIVAPRFSLQTDGKVPEHVYERIERELWMLESTDRRARLGIPVAALEAAYGPRWRER